MKRTAKATEVRHRRNEDMVSLRRWGPVAVLVALWGISNALLLDVRAGLGQGFVRGYLTLVRYEVSAPAATGIPSSIVWEIHVAPAPGGSPSHRFGLFLGMTPQQLRDRLTREGVPLQGVPEDGLKGPGLGSRWADTRKQYRVEYAGLGRRVVTGVQPLP